MQVDTLVIGAGRSGTTTLCSYLEEHPMICYSVIKELHYFSIEDLYKRGQKYYHSFFKKDQDQPITATSDTYLLMDHAAIQRIKTYNPDMRIIVLLRNPVDRAYSSYNYSVNYGHHQAYNSFLDSIDNEKGIEEITDIVKRNNLGHFYGSLYHFHLSKWEEAFGKDHLLVLTTELLKNDPAKLQKKICDFLGIEYQPSSDEEKRLNPNAIPKFKTFERFLLNRDNFLRKLIRAIVPSFIKRWIIHSNIVENLHNLNRKGNAYTPLTDIERNQADLFFKDDLAKLAQDFGIRF